MPGNYQGNEQGALFNDQVCMGECDTNLFSSRNRILVVACHPCICKFKPERTCEGVSFSLAHEGTVVPRETPCIVVHVCAHFSRCPKYPEFYGVVFLLRE